MQNDKSVATTRVPFTLAWDMRRGKLEMIKGILEAARRGATKTEIVYRSNLNFKIADQCLAGLLKAGYVTVEEDRDRKAQFHTTEKGVLFLVELTRLGRALAELLAVADDGHDERTGREVLAPSIR